MPSEANIQVASLRRQVILSWQDFGPRRRKRAPEERLMIAVLHDALDCLEKYRFATGREGRRLFHQTKRWFLTDDTQWPYSFERICGALDLDASAVRRRIAIRAVAQRTSRSLETPKSGTSGY
jgi:hypothetical protein